MAQDDAAPEVSGEGREEGWGSKEMFYLMTHSTRKVMSGRCGASETPNTCNKWSGIVILKYCTTDVHMWEWRDAAGSPSNNNNNNYNNNTLMVR